MDEDSQQSSNSQQSLADPRLAHQKVLQPDASFVAEVKAAQQTAANQGQPALPAAPQSSTQTPQTESNPPQRPIAPASSIYPDATKDIGVPSNKPSFDFPGDEPEAAAVKQTSKAKILVVRAVAAVMILINAVNAYNWWLYYRHNTSFT